MLGRNIVLFCVFALATGQVIAEDKIVLNSDKAKLSYSIGASIGKNLKTEATEIDVNVLIEGMKTALSGEKGLLSEKEIRQVMSDYTMKLRAAATARNQKAISENKKKGDAFLADYKTQKDVLSLPSGVLYKVIKEGTGKKPMESDMVEVNYRGTLINGTEFDATEPGHPANLKVSALIPGWKQALSMMPTGSKWHLVIPPVLAYGERGVGNDIGPNEVLEFDLELIAIK